jgi:glutamate 5-kinase
LGEIGITIVKVGTKVLTNSRGWISEKRVRSIAEQVAINRQRTSSFIIVTSGAIATGLSKLAIDASAQDLSLTLKQVCAAVGQPSLMYLYNRCFSRYGIDVAQILLTEEDLANKYRYRNFWRTLTALLKKGVIPIINENDAISVKELVAVNPYVPDSVRFGDNDRLSAIIASRVRADLLIVLTDVDGFMMPGANGTPKMVKELKRIDKRTLSYASGSSELGLGGMLSKLQAARIASRSGVTTVIANGHQPDVLTKIMHGERVGTLIKPART